MTSSTHSAVWIETAVLGDAESVLDEGESLSDFVAECLRAAVAWRRTQDAFVLRARDAVERGVREGGGFTPQELLERLDRRQALRTRNASDPG